MLGDNTNDSFQELVDEAVLEVDLTKRNHVEQLALTSFHRVNCHADTLHTLFPNVREIPIANCSELTSQSSTICSLKCCTQIVLRSDCDSFSFSSLFLKRGFSFGGLATAATADDASHDDAHSEIYPT